MKQKRTNGDPVTHQQLTAELDNLHMKTKEEISASEIRTEIKIEQQQMKTDDNARKYRDEVLTKMDGLALQLKTMIDEQVIVNERNRRTLERIENHESRLTKLEKAQRHN